MRFLHIVGYVSVGDNTSAITDRWLSEARVSALGFSTPSSVKPAWWARRSFQAVRMRSKEKAESRDPWLVSGMNEADQARG
jgi:hypothetical protein